MSYLPFPHMYYIFSDFPAAMDRRPLRKCSRTNKKSARRLERWRLSVETYAAAYKFKGCSSLVNESTMEMLCYNSVLNYAKIYMCSNHAKNTHTHTLCTRASASALAPRQTEHQNIVWSHTPHTHTHSNGKTLALTLFPFECVVRKMYGMRSVWSVAEGSQTVNAF